MMKRTLFSTLVVLFVLTVAGTTLVSGDVLAAADDETVTTAEESPAPAAVADPQDTPPPPPQGVSPADPGIEPPETVDCRCWRCGAANRCDGRMHKGRYGGPMLSRGARDARGARRHHCEDAFRGHGMRGKNGHGSMWQGRGVAAERLLRHAPDLELTEEQVAKLETLAYETKKRLIDLHADIEKEQLEIHKQMQSGRDDLTQIKRHLGAIAQARAGIQEAKIENLFEARKILTDEQRKMVGKKYPRLGRTID